MSDGSDLEKTEPPSPRRLEKAREEGQVARSHELATFFALLAGGLGFSVLGAQWVSHTTTALQANLVLTRRDAFEPAALGEHLGAFASDALVAIVPLLLLVAIAAIAGTSLLGGFVFSTKAFRFDLSRLSPVRGLRRTWSIDGASELVKAVVKSLLLGAICGWILWSDRETFARFGSMSLVASLTALGHLMVRDLLLLTAGLALIGGLDAPVQLWRHRKSLRMTKQELRDEARESEGDPAQRSRIRALQRQAAQRRMMAEVPKADAIVVDPAHFAVAIAYDATMGAPKVLAKGSAMTALRIREIAAEHRILVVEARPLARALYRHAGLGREIPSTLFESVALVMAYVYQVRHHDAQGGAYPAQPIDLPVPDDLVFEPVGDDEDRRDDEPT